MVNKITNPPSQKDLIDKVNEVIDNLVESDNSTINKNSSNQLQAIGLINKNTASSATNPKYDWVGTLQQYNDQAVATNHPEWICYITDDVSGGASVYTKAETNSEIATAISTILEALYPVGSVYITTDNTCPLSALIAGSTWTLKSSGIVTSVDTNVPVKGNGIALGLLGSTGGNLTFGMASQSNHNLTGFGDMYGKPLDTTLESGGQPTTGHYALGITTDASKSGIVGTVTRSTLSVNIFERTA